MRMIAICRGVIRRAWDRLDVGPWQAGALIAFVLYLLVHLAAAKAAGRI